MGVDPYTGLRRRYDDRARYDRARYDRARYDGRVGYDYYDSGFARYYTGKHRPSSKSKSAGIKQKMAFAYKAYMQKLKSKTKPLGRASLAYAKAEAAYKRVLARRSAAVPAAATGISTAYRYSVGYAPDDGLGASCQSCGAKIAKGALCIARATNSTDTQYFHAVHAFGVFARSRCSSRVPTSASRDLSGFSKLARADQKKLEAQVAKLAAARKRACGSK